MGLDGFAGTGWGAAAVVVGALAGLGVVSRARAALAMDAGESAPAQERVSA